MNHTWRIGDELLQDYISEEEAQHGNQHWIEEYTQCTSRIESETHVAGFKKVLLHCLSCLQRPAGIVLQMMIWSGWRRRLGLGYGVAYRGIAIGHSYIVILEARDQATREGERDSRKTGRERIAYPAMFGDGIGDEPAFRWLGRRHMLLCSVTSVDRGQRPKSPILFRFPANANRDGYRDFRCRFFRARFRLNRFGRTVLGLYAHP